MGDHSVSLNRELKSLRQQLVKEFEKEQWSKLSGTLESIARVGEDQGQRELCLRAQCLRELMGERASGGTGSGNRLLELFNELMFHLSHLQWKCQTTH